MIGPRETPTPHLRGEGFQPCGRASQLHKDGMAAAMGTEYDGGLTNISRPSTCTVGSFIWNLARNDADPKTWVDDFVGRRHNRLPASR